MEYCSPENYIKREQYYLDRIKPEYNILKIARSSLGFKHSEETIEKLKTISKGRAVSEEHKVKLSLATKGIPRSEEVKANMYKKLHNRVEVQVLDKKNGTTEVFMSMSAAGKNLGGGVHHNIIRKHADYRLLLNGRYKIKIV